MCNTITKNDIYERKVTFMHNGKDGFKTIWGGLVSTMIIIVLFLVFLGLFIQLVTFKNSTYNVRTIIKDLLDDTTKHYIAENDFAVALAYVNTLSGDIGSNLLTDPTYFDVQMFQLQGNRNNGNYDFSVIDIPLEK